VDGVVLADAGSIYWLGVLSESYAGTLIF
jgi:hypothetical protein